MGSRDLNSGPHTYVTMLRPCRYLPRSPATGTMFYCRNMNPNGPVTRNLGVHIWASGKDTDSAQLSGPTGTGEITGGSTEGREAGKNEVNREKSRTGKGREAERKG